MLENEDFNRSISLAGDQKYSDNAVDNLCSYLRHGSHEELLAAIRLLGSLRPTSALQPLLDVLEECEHSLRPNEAELGLPGSAGHGLAIIGEICDSLARYDCDKSHKTLLRLINSSGNQWVRFTALRATGFESNWHDEHLVRRYLKQKRSTKLRVAALWAIHETSGYRLDGYKALVLPLLADGSPSVIIAAVDVLALFIHRDNAIMTAFEPLLADNRFCNISKATVAHYVSSYFELTVE